MTALMDLVDEGGGAARSRGERKRENLDPLMT